MWAGVTLSRCASLAGANNLGYYEHSLDTAVKSFAMLVECVQGKLTNEVRAF
jgi:hypothetical protein